MVNFRKTAIAFGALVVMALGILGSGAAQASVPLPVSGSLTVTVPGSTTPITLTAGQATPAMTYTAFGIGLSGFGTGNSLPTNIQVRPSSLTIWSAADSPKFWTPLSTCPTGNNNPSVSSTTLSDCGISAVYINDVAVSNLKVYVEDNTSSIANTLIISSTTGNTMFTTPDSVGTVRVELMSGAWSLHATAATNQLFSMLVRSAGGSQQGSAYTWTRSVTFDANSGTGAQYSQTAVANTTTALTANRFTKNGYYLSGWTTAADGTGTRYSPGENYTFAANETLFAEWTLSTSGTVSFDPNNGSGTMVQQTASNIAALSKSTLTRTGYSFAGWNTSADGSGTDYTDEQQITFDGPMTLYAMWRRNPGTVSFDANGGTGNMGQQTVTGEAAINTATLTRAGYTFAGWNTLADGSGTPYEDGDLFDFLGDTTLFAQWIAIPAPDQSTVTAGTSANLVNTGFTHLPFVYASVFGFLLLGVGGVMIVARRLRRI